MSKAKDTTPQAKPPVIQNNRRAALKKMGRYAAYSAPVIATMLASKKAHAS